MQKSTFNDNFVLGVHEYQKVENCWPMPFPRIRSLEEQLSSGQKPTECSPSHTLFFVLGVCVYRRAKRVCSTVSLIVSECTRNCEECKHRTMLSLSFRFQLARGEWHEW
jgi:hypothetical protein